MVPAGLWEVETLRLLTALLYMATSLAVTVSYLVFTGAMLGMTTPILTLRTH